MNEQGGDPKVLDDVYVNKPSTLQQTCIDEIGKNYQIILQNPKKNADSSNSWQISKSISLPLLLSDDIFQYLLKHSVVPTVELIWAFSNNKRCSLRNCKLHNVEDLPYKALSSLCANQNLQTLDLCHVDFSSPGGSLAKLLTGTIKSYHVGIQVNCQPTSHSIKVLSKHDQPNLRSLKVIGSTVAWYLVINRACPPALTTLELSNFPQDQQPANVVWEFNVHPQSGVQVENDVMDDHWSPDHDDRDMVIDAINAIPLEDLDAIMVSDNEQSNHDEADTDASNNSPLLMRYRLESMKETLVSLTLYQTFLGPKDFSVIFQLYKLQHLDIGHRDAQTASWGNNRPDISLWDILDALPRLESLDVSCTEIGDRLYGESPSKSITGERYLNSPIERRLEFLGLLETEGCEISNISMLADKVTGYANESQMITGIEAYIQRPVQSTTCYNHLYTLIRNQAITCPHKLLRLLLKSMESHPQESQLLLACMANFYFLTRRFYSVYSKQQLRRIILAIVKCLEQNQTSNMVIRNCVLTMFHFDVPGDFIFCYERVARVVLGTFKRHQRSNDINLIAVHLCNTLVCSLESDMKKEVSEKLDFVRTILEIITTRHTDKLCDEVMEVCWSTLWNVTDETPKNSSDFIDFNGLTLLQECFNTFNDKMELHKNMMGLIGNIAEVKELRPFLCTKNLINLFRTLMVKNENIEISYNSCGALAHIMSDGTEAWKINDPERDQVLKEMYDVIELWDVNSARHINYRSFKPILRLIEGNENVSIHWACWALCNLSGLEPRYCRLLLSENGKEILKTLERKEIFETTKQYVNVILRRLESYENRGQNVLSEP